MDEDNTYSIIDVISINKYILGVAHYLPCQKLAADADRNGTIDAADSLAILREVVGMTVNFEELSVNSP